MTSRDVTDPERIECELRESRDDNRGMIESDTDALTATDPVGTAIQRFYRVLLLP